MGDYTVIRIDRDEHVAEIVLDSPERLNAMAPAFFHEMRQAYQEIDADDSVRVAIVWAEGRHFTAGLDLKAAAQGVVGGDNGKSQARRNQDTYDLIKDWQDCFSWAGKCKKPIIAAVHGHCIGGGVDLTTACDIRLCTKGATFSIHETKIAIVADVGTLQRITNVVGKGMAREMAFTGARLGAERALHCGLVNAVYDDKEALLAGARALAQEIAANSPFAVQGTKQVLNFSDEHSLDEGLEYVAQYNSAFLHTDDMHEAIQAFLEKRQPEFTGT